MVEKKQYSILISGPEHGHVLFINGDEYNSLEEGPEVDGQDKDLTLWKYKDTGFQDSNGFRIFTILPDFSYPPGFIRQ